MGFRKSVVGSSGSWSPDVARKDPTLRELFAEFPARLQFSDPVVIRALKDAFTVDIDGSTLILDPDEEFPDGCCQAMRVSVMFKDVEGDPHFGHIVFSVSMEDGLITLEIDAENASAQQASGTVH